LHKHHEFFSSTNVVNTNTMGMSTIAAALTTPSVYLLVFDNNNPFSHHYICKYTPPNTNFYCPWLSEIYGWIEMATITDSDIFVIGMNFLTYDLMLTKMGKF
jgi:hypothetical protein